MEGAQARQGEAATLVQVASGGRPGDPRLVMAEVSLENVHDAEVLPTLLTILRYKLGRVYTVVPMTAKSTIDLSRAKGRQAVFRHSLAETAMYRFKQLLAGKPVCVTTMAKWEKSWRM